MWVMFGWELQNMQREWDVRQSHLLRIVSRHYRYGNFARLTLQRWVSTFWGNDLNFERKLPCALRRFLRRSYSAFDRICIKTPKIRFFVQQMQKTHLWNSKSGFSPNCVQISITVQCPRPLSPFSLKKRATQPTVKVVAHRLHGPPKTAALWTTRTESCKWE